MGRPRRQGDLVVLMIAMKNRELIAFRAPFPSFAANKMFEAVHHIHVGDSTHWMQPYKFLRATALTQGLELQTEDMLDLNSASVLILLELPTSIRDLEAIRKKYPHLKIILQILETPVGRLWTFDEVNHRCFDAVLTYNERLREKAGYFIYKIPAGGLESWDKTAVHGLPWESRKTACIVSNAPNLPPRFPRRKGLGLLRAGWRFTPHTWWNYVTEGGSLQRQRLSVATHLARAFPSDFDIYGPAWDQLKDSKIVDSWKGPWLGSKLDLLGRYKFNIAYENCDNDVGYISEKIFDAFLSGSVPVYLGNQRIEEWVPPASFVDARGFPPRQIGNFLKGISQEKWNDMREAGDKFMSNAAQKYFGAAQYANAVISAISYVMRNQDSRFNAVDPKLYS